MTSSCDAETSRHVADRDTSIGYKTRVENSSRSGRCRGRVASTCASEAAPARPLGGLKSLPSKNGATLLQHEETSLQKSYEILILAQGGLKLFQYLAFKMYALDVNEFRVYCKENFMFGLS